MATAVKEALDRDDLHAIADKPLQQNMRLDDSLGPAHRRRCKARSDSARA
jgi:hypothetical protein